MKKIKILFTVCVLFCVNNIISQTTTLKATFCGTTLAKLNTPLNCTSVAGATKYGWEVTDMTTNSVFTYTVNSTSIAFCLTNIPQCTYGKTYGIRIMPYIGASSTWGSYGSSCSVSSPTSIPYTSLTSSFCGTILPKLNTSLTCISVPGATKYGWEVKDTLVDGTV